MADNLYNHITPNILPSNSQDLNPLDYYAWSVVEGVNEHPHNTKDSRLFESCQSSSNVLHELGGVNQRI